MNDKLLKLMSEMELASPCKLEILKALEEELGFTLPVQYVEFMKLHNGGEGPIGDYGYLAIWDIEEVRNFNVENKHLNQIKDLFYFASDRGGTLYAYEICNSLKKVVELQEDSTDYSEVEEIAESFELFVQYIYDIDDSEFE